MREETSRIIEAYADCGINACTAKGGFFVEGRGFVSLAQARKETGINMAQKREASQVQGAWGEYGWLAAINGARG